MDNLDLIRGNQDPTKGMIRNMFGKVAFDDGDGDAAAAAAAASAAAEATKATGRFTDNFADKDLKSNPSFTKFENTESLGKAYISLERKLGANPIVVPKEGASEEDVSNYHKSIGRPDTPEAYQLVPPQDLHKGIVSDATSQKDFRAAAFKAGLTGKQAGDLHNLYLNSISNALKQQDVADEKARNEAETALRGKWGTTFESNIALATKIVNKFGGEKAQELLDKGLGNHPAMLEMLVAIGSKLSEDALGPGGKSIYGALTPAAAEAKKQEIMANSKHPYHNDGPLHKEAVDEMLTLNKIITGVA